MVDQAGNRTSAQCGEDILTATALMIYVYSKVSNDIHSNQTPHYGHFEGDGDFVLLAPQLDHDDGITEPWSE